MKIRKAKKEDFKEYLELKRQEEKDYSKITKQKINYPKDKVLKKEYNKALISKKRQIVIKAENKV